MATGFAYLGQPSSPVPADAATVTLADAHEDAVRALTDLAALVAPGTAAKVAAAARPALPSGPLTLQSWPQVLAALLPEDGWTSPQMLRRYGASARSARARCSYDRVMEDAP